MGWVGIVMALLLARWQGAVSAMELQKRTHPLTFCNPINIEYRFGFSLPWVKESRREAADPAIVVFKGEYWLFASKAGGYWHSSDMVNWKRVSKHGFSEQIIEAYAPAVVVMNNRLYFTANGLDGIYSTDDPAKGEWRQEVYFPEKDRYVDPAMLVDDDGRFFLYDGCVRPIAVTELDPKNGFKQINRLTGIMQSDHLRRGWEVNGANNRGGPWKMKDGTINDGCKPCVEGVWMTKHGRKYYLQYATPSTQSKTYGDGVFVGDNPMLARRRPCPAGGTVWRSQSLCRRRGQPGDARCGTETLSRLHRLRSGLHPGDGLAPRFTLH